MEARLDFLGLKQLPYATARALTDTAQAARLQIGGDMGKIFESPVPFTVNALGYKPASKSDLCALVFVKDIQAKYLLHEEEGGERTPAENTRKPSAALIVPSKIKLNQYGNIPSGAIARLFKAISADATRQLTPRQAKRKKRVDASRAPRDKGYFYMMGHGPVGGPGGVFKRMPGHTLLRLVSFEPAAHYRPRFHFDQRVRFVVLKAFAPALAKRLAEAMR